MILTLLACGGGSSIPQPEAAPVEAAPIVEAAAEPAAEPAAPVVAAEAAPAAAAPSGTWHSMSCGERAYARELTFDVTGTYTGKDLVSPCPPNARCIWSGVVTFSGTWVVEGSEVVLTETSSDNAAGLPRPARVTFNGAPAEGSCSYTAGIAPRTAMVPGGR